MKSLDTLIPRLKQATLDGKLKWGKDQWSAYTCTLGKTSIKVWNWSSPEDDTTGVSVNLYRGNSSNGEVLDAVIADQFDSAYANVFELYSVARRSALNVDAVISEIEDELDKL